MSYRRSYACELMLLNNKGLNAIAMIYKQINACNTQVNHERTLYKINDCSIKLSSGVRRPINIL